jgi:two-component system response regulator DcuR
MGTASTLRHAQEIMSDPAQKIDLALLDVYMQQDNGLDLLPTIRTSGRPLDVIMISSATDAATIQKSLHYGVVDYLIKPFRFPRFEEALTTWKEKKNLLGAHKYHEQSDVDRLLRSGAPEVTDTRRLPKGLTPQTLRIICRWIDAHPGVEFSTDDLANAVNISRVSCRKYLIWLAQINILFISMNYGATGRPVYRYRLLVEQYWLLKQFCQ